MKHFGVKGPCQYCAQKKEKYCAAEVLVTADGVTVPLQCTRERGHLGQHVACGTHYHRMAVWRSETRHLRALVVDAIEAEGTTTTPELARLAEYLGVEAWE